MNANKPSITALSVTKHLLILAKDKKWNALIPPAAIAPMRWFLEASPLGQKSLQWVQSWWIRGYLKLIERLIIPGLSLHFALRKRWIEQQTLQALEEGVKRVIILGAGFDTLAYRLHTSFPQVDWMEIDHPATQKLKKEAFAKHAELASNLTLISVDFTEQSLKSVLDPLDPKPTLFIAEGLLMYLTEEQVLDMLQQMSEGTDEQSLLIGTALQPLENGRLAFAEARWLSPDKQSEPFLWGTTPAKLPPFLNRQSWLHTSTSYTKEQLLADFPEYRNTHVPQGEYLFATRKKAYTTKEAGHDVASDLEERLLQTK